jgi:hypothetical protein
VTAITAAVCAIVYLSVVWSVSQSVRSIRRFGRGGDRSPEMRIPRSRALGLGVKRGPRADLPRRGDERGACAIFRGLGRRAHDREYLLSGQETPYAYGRGRAWRPAGYRTVRSGRGGVPAQTKPDPAPLGRVEGHEVSRCCSPWARAAQDKRYTPSPPDIARRPDRLARARSPSTRERRAKARSRRGGPCLQLLSVAPVLLDTSATILDTTASISGSVSVRSRGCRVT